MTRLDGAKVLITGAGGGFGRALTRLLLAKGAQLILTDHPSVNLSSQLATPQNDGQQGRILACLDIDLAAPDGCDALYAATAHMDALPDVLINNAGMALVGRMADIPPEQWELMLRVNLLVPMRLSCRFAADMTARGQGHIVNISSLAGWIAVPGLTAYAASKYGLRGFGEGLRHELAPCNVQVTTVYPSFSRTPLLKSPKFGRYSEIKQTLPSAITTDPDKVMTSTVRAIERNLREVFPDGYSLAGHWIARYLPLALRLLDKVQPS